MFPRQFYGKPVMLSEGLENPYDKVGTALGHGDMNGAIRAIAEKASGSLDKLLSATLIFDPNNPGSSGDNIEHAIRERFGDGASVENSPFFLVDEMGKTMSLGSIDFMRRNGGKVEMIGNFNYGIQSGLAEKKALAGITSTHHSAETELMDLPMDSILVEIGAGGDVIRINSLNEYAKSKNSRLICQEQVPDAAHKVSKVISDIPYIPVPTRRGLLDEVFNDTDNPITFSMQNVISSMSMGGLNEFLAVAGSLKAHKIIITQSLALADNSNMLPEQLRPGTESFSAYILQNLDPRILGSVGHQELVTLIHQAGLTVKLLIMELMRRYIQNPNRSGDLFARNRTTLLETSNLLEGEDALEKVRSFSPNLIEPFMDKKFNTLVMGPFFSIQVNNDPKVPPGKLKFTSSQFTLEVAKRFGPIDQNSHPETRFTSIPMNQVIPPKLFRSTNPFLFPIDEKINRKAFMQTGAEVGYRYVFGLLGNMGHILVRDCPNPIRKLLYDEFVKGI